MGLETCIDHQDLKKFALGHLDEERSDEIAAHLSACSRCEETIAGFDDTDDSMLAGVREAAVENTAEAAEIPAEAALLRIPNPWGQAGDSQKTASTGEWVRDYELLEPLGRGGMGTVYKAVHARLQRPVAIKLLPSRRLQDPDAVARFEREMRAIGRLDHPAIVRATDAGDADGTHFLVMDYVEGIDLSQLIKLIGPIEVASACEVIRQVATALQYAHDQGLIHRDVKPSNLMVEVVARERQGSSTRENEVLVKLLDLGLALFGAASEAVDELTTVGQLMGTLDYMAPEQADNSHDVDARADVYSLGATMFKLLTGTAPYETPARRTPLQKMKALATIDAPSIKTRLPALPDDVAEIVDRMLLRDPASRFQTAAEVAQAVTPFCSGHRLVEVTQQAMQSRHHAPRDEPASRPVNSNNPSHHKDLPDAAALAGADQKALKGTGATRPPRRLITRSVMATLGAIIIMAGIFIRIKTDTGTLVIECAASDVPIEIRQGNDVVKQLSLVTGENKVTLRSGSYEIVLPAEYDSLTLDAGKFELSRGGEWVARISESPEHIQIADVPDDVNSLVDHIDPMLMPSTPNPLTPEIARIISDPIQQIEFQRLRDRYLELLRKIDSLQDSKASAEIKYGEYHPNLTSLIRSRDQAEIQSAEVRQLMKHMLDEARLTSKANAIEAGVETMLAAAHNGQPLYAGKNFDQWLQVIHTERSQEGLAQALDAIGVLGRGEHDREAANVILDVMGRNGFVDWLRHSASESQVTISATRSMRGLNPDETVSAIADEFSTRPPSVHEFVFLGLLSVNEILTLSADNRISLGKTEPLTSRLHESEQLANQVIKLSELNSGIWNAEKYPSFSSRGDDYIFNFVHAHVGTSKPSPEIDAYLRTFTFDPEQLPVGQSLTYTAVAAATILARHTPDELHARIFVRAIQNSLNASTESTRAGNPGGGFFGNRPPAVQVQIPAWRGFGILGKHAEPALPYMFEILQHPSDEDSDVNELITESRRSDDGATSYHHQANMRLFAIETIGVTQTRDSMALEILRTELMRLIGQTPGDGPFELTPGRHALLISPEDARPMNIPFSTTQTPPREISPVHIELTNSCLLAWKALTGNYPRFTSDSLDTLTNTTGTTGVNIAFSKANMPKFVSHESDVQ